MRGVSNNRLYICRPITTMTAEQLKALYEKCRSGKATPEEQRLFESHQDDFDLSDDLPWTPEMGDHEQIKARLLEDMEDYLSPKRSVRRSLWRWTAAAVILIGSGVIFWNAQKQVDQPVAAVVKKEVIKPGTDKATLTLSNGQVIPVDQIAAGTITTQSNVTVVKNDQGQIIYTQKGSEQDMAALTNIMSTPRGGQHKVVLADGTQVWLNAETTLKYPVSFTGKERVVELTGEAYFEVEHDAGKPFKVISPGQEVEVLGTHFDVKAYADETTIRTTLLTGSVRITAKNNQVILKPGQQATLAANKDINVDDVNANDAIAWENGYFMFKNENIQSVMKTIARWYDVDVSYQGDVQAKRLGGTVSRYENLTDLLKTIELTQSVKFKIEGRRVIVMP